MAMKGDLLTNIKVVIMGSVCCQKSLTLQEIFQIFIDDLSSLLLVNFTVFRNNVKSPTFLDEMFE